MAISVTNLKHRCLEVVRRVERTRRPVSITRHGRVVAHLTPDVTPPMAAGETPWARLRQAGGSLTAAPEVSVLRDEDFEAGR